MTELAVVDDRDDALNRLGHNLVASGCFPDTKTAAQAVVKVLAGEEYGLGPVDAMGAFHVLGDGRIRPTAAFLARLVKGHPTYHYTVDELTDEVCALTFWEGGEVAGASRFTMADAERAGLNGSAWKKYPANMLFARAITNGVAWYAPDVLAPSVGSGAPAQSVSVLRGPVDVPAFAPDPDASGAVPFAASDEAGADEAPAYGEGASGSDTSVDPAAPGEGEIGPASPAVPDHDHVWIDSPTVKRLEVCTFPDCLATRTKRKE